jgi:pyridinium-3,5-biscarboxylic acid mononucleotide synthase
MNPDGLRNLLEEVRTGGLSIAEAMEQLRILPFEPVPDATIDHHRELRTGFPEVVFAPGKTVAQVIEISRRILARNQTLLVTRVEEGLAREVTAAIDGLDHNPAARTLSRAQPKTGLAAGRVAIVAAGTADLPVAEEAAVTASLMVQHVERIYDVGVAGLHRLLARLPELVVQDAIVVAAGMEGALPSVVGGLVACPVVAVPTSVGYGASFGGLAALLGMLNSCAAGVTVVNIDNGFGAGYSAALMARRRVRPGEGS